MGRSVRDRSFGLKGSEWPGVGGRGRSNWWGCTLPLQAVGLVWGAPACAGEGRCSPPPGAMQEAVKSTLCSVSGGAVSVGTPYTASECKSAHLQGGGSWSPPHCTGEQDRGPRQALLGLLAAALRVSVGARFLVFGSRAHFVCLVHPRGADAREWASPPPQPLSPVSGHLAQGSWRLSARGRRHRDPNVRTQSSVVSLVWLLCFVGSRAP